MTANANYPLESYTFSLITQGNFKFYSLTLPSTVLAKTCFVTSREEDPEEGFQRVLDKERAKGIASYMESANIPIPSSIILSAQNNAEFTIKKGGRALQFRHHPKAFLVLDGQHRVYGFSLSEMHLRVPVIIFNGLSRQQESRLFIDINTKQKPVPTELLLDIKALAATESDEEAVMRSLFDMFNTEPASILFGKLAPSERLRGKLSRVSFNAACKPILSKLTSKSEGELYIILNAYLSAFAFSLDSIGFRELMFKPFGFKGILAFFPEVAIRVKVQFEGKYSIDNFSDVLSEVFRNLDRSQLVSAKASASQLRGKLSKAMAKNFEL